MKQRNARTTVLASLACLAGTVGAAASAGSAQIMTQGAVMLPKNVAPQTAYGHSVALGNNFIAVGSTSDDRVMIYTRKFDGSYSYRATIMDPLGRGKGVGFSLDVDGNTLVAGAPETSFCSVGPQASGVLQVYEISTSGNSDNATRSYAELRHDGIDRIDKFGADVAIDGDTIIGGAPYANTVGHSSGTAYVFRKVASGWTQEAKLVALDAMQGDLAGWSVDIDGNTAVVGAPFDSSTLLAGGSVQVFDRTAAGWIHTATIEAPAVRKEAYFGVSVSLDAGRLVIGETGTNKAYVFRRAVDGRWNIEKTWGGSGQFGAFVEILGEEALVASPQSRYVNRYRFDGSAWQLLQTIKPQGVGMGSSGTQFGSAIDLGNGQAVIGARYAGESGVAMHYHTRLDGTPERSDTIAK